MADFAVYWPDYLDESGDHGEPAVGWWFSRESIVKRLQNGDRFWLFVAGDAVAGSTEPNRAYLAQLMGVSGWCDNPDHDPTAPGSPRFEVTGDESRCVLVEPPLLIDHLLRKSADDLRHIGMLRQTPAELTSERVADLLELVCTERPAVYAAAVREPST